MVVQRRTSPTLSAVKCRHVAQQLSTLLVLPPTWVRRLLPRFNTLDRPLGCVPILSKSPRPVAVAVAGRACRLQVSRADAATNISVTYISHAGSRQASTLRHYCMQDAGRVRRTSNGDNVSVSPEQSTINARLDLDEVSSVNDLHHLRREHSCNSKRVAIFVPYPPPGASTRSASIEQMSLAK